MDRPKLLAQAYELAFFIHGDEETALRIVVSAAAKLELATTTQRKRLYYRPLLTVSPGSKSQPGFRHKILLSDIHLLQRLIYIESEPYETRSQQQKRQDDDDLVVYFIKHLMRITLRRNSFHVNLGISRLLYNYRTSEAMEIYNVVVQDPGRVKDDYYYRSRKGVLMSELKDRFGDVLRTCRGPHGEERFQTNDQARAFAQLVKECLSLFTPWATRCLVPDDFDPLVCEIPGLVSKRSNGDDPAEVNRVHSVTHPRCYERLAGSLGLLSPDATLSIPQFFLKRDHDGAGPGSRKRHTLPLDDEKLKAIEAELIAQAIRRKRCAPQLLRVVIDGTECASLRPSREVSIQIPISKDAELIEVKTADAEGELLLATHLVSSTGAANQDQPQDHKIVLEGNQEISMRVSHAGEHGHSMALTVGYRKGVRFFPFPLADQLRALTVQPKWLRAAAALTVLALVLFTLLFLIKMSTPKGGSGDQMLQVKSSPQPTPTVENSLGIKPKDIDKEKKLRPEPDDQSKKGKTPHKPAPLPKDPGLPQDEVALATDETRAPEGKRVGLSLLEVKRVFVESLVDDPSCRLVVQILRDRLPSSKRLLVAQTRDEADAVLKVRPATAAKASQRRGAFVVKLVNVNGDVLWPGGEKPRRALYSGSPLEVAMKTLEGLLGTIRQRERKPR